MGISTSLHSLCDPFVLSEQFQLFFTITMLFFNSDKECFELKNLSNCTSAMQLVQ